MVASDIKIGAVAFHFVSVRDKRMWHLHPRPPKGEKSRNVTHRPLITVIQTDSGIVYCEHESLFVSFS